MFITACGPTPVVPNAIALPGEHTLGTIRQYECSPGFVPDNPPQIECLVNAQWSPVGFACVGKSCKITTVLTFSWLDLKLCAITYTSDTFLYLW